MKRSLLLTALFLGTAHAAPLELGPLTLGATHQARVAHLIDQFRVAAPGDDTLVSLRTTVDAKLAFDVFRAELEVADIRAYRADDNTPLNTGMINALDLLQANAGVQVPVGEGDLRGRVGRITLDLGRRQLIARNRFRNGINAFDGVHLDWQAPRTQAHVFGFAPVIRVPDAQPELADNTIEFDAPQFETWYFGAFVRQAFGERFSAEGFVFVLDEQDGRALTTPGFRLRRAPASGALDADFEVMIQTGESAPGLDHRAASGHISFGYTFATRATPRLSLAYDYASGDRDPNDGVNQRFDPLFGVARPDFGPTGLWTAFTRRNINTPGVRVDVKPHARVDAFVFARAIWLDQPRDAWVSSGLRDPISASDPYVGEQVEARARWHIMPKQLRLEAGFAWLRQAAFVEATAPGAANPLYGYLQINAAL